MNIKFEEFQKQSLIRIESLISGVVKAKKPATIFEPARYILEAGGKRMRPMLVLLGCKAVGGDQKSCLPAAVALRIWYQAKFALNGFFILGFRE